MKPKVNNSIVNIQTVVGSKPKMHWIWADVGGFPFGEIMNTEDHSPSILDDFSTAILQANSRIWIMDPHFDHKVGLRCLWVSLCYTEASEVKIISHEDFEGEWINKLEEEFDVSMTIKLEWRKGFFQLHDRFAIIDNQFWHFGSTVGGGFYKYGAATSGWSSGLLEKVFMSQWEKCGR